MQTQTTINNINNTRSVLRVETTGFLIEAAAGIAVIILAIIAFANADSRLLISISSIVLGAALFAQGIAIASEYRNILEMGGAAEQYGAMEIGGGMTVEILAGGAAVVLGILGLLGYVPLVLQSIVVITIGVALILAAGGYERMNSLRVLTMGTSELGQRVAQNMANGAIAAQVLAGGAAIVLGILALTIPVQAPLLTLVGLLVLGAALTINGAAFTGRLVSLFR